MEARLPGSCLLPAPRVPVISEGREREKRERQKREREKREREREHERDPSPLTPLATLVLKAVSANMKIQFASLIRKV